MLLTVKAIHEIWEEKREDAKEGERKMHMGGKWRKAGPAKMGQRTNVVKGATKK